MTTILETAQEVLRLDGLATPGEWLDPWKQPTRSKEANGIYNQDKTEVVIADLLDDFHPLISITRENSSLIAHYRSAAPALAREVIRLAAEVEALREAARRRDVFHELPDDNVMVIAIRKCAKYSYPYYAAVHCEGEWYANGGKKLDNVTHWMPIHPPEDAA